MKKVKAISNGLFNDPKIWQMPYNSEEWNKEFVEKHYEELHKISCSNINIGCPIILGTCGDLTDGAVNAKKLYENPELYVPQVNNKTINITGGTD